MIAETEDLEGLKEALSALPLVRSGFLELSKVSQLRPYSGFGPRSS